jgi:hypothetical protein
VKPSIKPSIFYTLTSEITPILKLVIFYLGALNVNLNILTFRWSLANISMTFRSLWKFYSIYCVIHKKMSQLKKIMPGRRKKNYFLKKILSVCSSISFNLDTNRYVSRNARHNRAVGDPESGGRRVDPTFPRFWQIS